MRKHTEVPREYKQQVYKELLRINLSVKNLLNKHTFVLYEKENELPDVNVNIESMMKPFHKIM
jgi:hypothetical protein